MTDECTREAAQKTKMKLKPSGIIKTTSRPPRTTKNTTLYMRHLMKYEPESIRLLLGIFRHKMVHLAHTKPAIVDRNRIIAWRYDHQGSEKHLAIEKLRQPMKLKVRAPYDLYCDHGFRISISKLAQDIKESVLRKHDGYLELLRKKPRLQLNFRRAINEIYNTTKN